METIQDSQKIGLISLADKIESKELSLNQAYKKSVEELHYGGSIANFIEMMKAEGLIDKEEIVEVKKINIKKIAAIGIVGIGVVLLVKSLNKK